MTRASVNVLLLKSLLLHFPTLLGCILIKWDGCNRGCLGHLICHVPLQEVWTVSPPTTTREPSSAGPSCLGRTLLSPGTAPDSRLFPAHASLLQRPSLTVDCATPLLFLLPALGFRNARLKSIKS